MQSKRALLLASTAMVSLGALGFLPERSFAAATCAPSGDTLTCTGTGTSAEVNAVIVAQPGPNLNVIYDANAKIDTATGDVTINGQAQFTGTVSHTNGGQIGLETGGLPNNNDKGLLIIGKTDSATNNATITNNKLVYGRLDIGNSGLNPVGGTGTIINNGLTTGTVNLFSVGNATLTSNAAGPIWGAVTVSSRGPNKVEANIPATGFTTTTTTGGVASVNIAADVGKLADPTKAESSTNKFTGSSIVVDSGGGAAGLVLSARSGSATVSATAFQTVKGTNVGAADSAGNVTTVTKNNTTVLTGAGGANIATTGQVLGTLAVDGTTSATAVVNGVVGTGGGTPLSVTSNYASTTSEKTTVVDSAAVLRTQTTVTQTKDSAGTATVVVGAGGLVDGGASIVANGDTTLTVDGSIGRVKSDGTVVGGSTSVEIKASTITNATVLEFNDKGKLVTQTTGYTSTDTAGKFTGVIGPAGLVNGPLTVMTGGDVDITINGKLGNAAVSGTALNAIAWKGNEASAPANFSTDRTFSDVQTFDPATGTLTKEVLSDIRTASGGGGTLTVGTGAEVTGSVQLLTDKAIKFVNNGRIIGNTTLTARRPNNLQTSDVFVGENTTTTDATTKATTNVIKTTETVVTQTIGGAVTADNNSLNSILGDLTITALGDITFNSPGFISGNVTLKSDGNATSGTTTANVTTVVTPVDPADPTKGSSTATSATSTFSGTTTITGGSVNSTVAGIIGVDNTLVGTFPVTVVPGTAYVQSANKASNLTIPTSGRIFEKVSSFGGATTTTGTQAFATNSDSTPTVTEVKNYDGAAVLIHRTRTATSSASSSSTVSAGSSSAITIAGQVLKNTAGAVSPVLSQAVGGASVNVTGGLVEGAVTASTANQANSTASSSSTQSFTIDKDGKYSETGFTGSSTSTQTGVGGAATVTVTGSGSRVTGLVTAQGSSGATVTIDATGRADAGVTAKITVPNDIVSKGDTVRSYSDAKNFTQTDTASTTNAPAAISGNALATLNGKVGGAVNVNSTTGNATATVNVSTANLITDVNVSALASKSVSSSKNVWSGTTTPTAAPGSQPSGTFLAVTQDSSSTTTSVGGNATANLTAVAGISGGAATDLLVKGNINIQGDKSANLTVGAGVRVGTVNTGNTIFLQSLPTQTSSTSNSTFVKGVLDTNKTVSETHFVGGTATALNGLGVITFNNAGELRTGSITANAAGGTKAITFSNTGRIGVFGVPITGSPPIIGFPVQNFTFLNAIQSDAITTTTSSGGASNFGLATSSTTVDQRIPVGGTVVADNSGFHFGGLHVAAANGTVNNKAGAALGALNASPQGLTFGASQLINYTSTTSTTPTSTTGPTVVVPTTLFVQSYTLNQDALLAGGIFVQGALGDSVTGTTKTSNVTATLNLNNGSVTLGGIDSQVSGSARTAQTNIDVNLNGTGFLGMNVGSFDVDPALSGTQLEFLGANPASLTKSSPFYNNSSLPNVVGTIRHARNIVKSGTGTFYITGSGLQNFATPAITDDLFDLQATTFTINQGGEVQFSLLDETKIYGINATVTNNGTFVYGARVTALPLNNLTANLQGASQLINGLDFRVEGNVTQSATGKSVLTVMPALIRNQPFIGSFSTSPEVLGVPTQMVSVGLFTTPANFFGPTGVPNDSTMFVNGNLTLGGTVEALTVRQGLYTAGFSLPVWTVTGTVTLNSPTVTSGVSSPFVKFGLETTKSGSNTIVSIVTSRTSFSSVAENESAGNTGTGLDADLTYVSGRLAADAAGQRVFATIEEFRNAQDLANILSGMDFLLSPAESAQVLNEISSGGVYGSVLAIDRTRSLVTSIDGMIDSASLSTMSGARWWLQPTFRSTHLNTNEETGALGLRSNEVGATFGGEWRMDRFGIGFAGGYGSERLQHNVSGDIETWMAGAYGYFVQGPLHVGAQFTYGNSNYDLERALPTLSRSAEADFNGHTTGVKGEVGYAFPIMQTMGTITPYASIEFKKLVAREFTETGAAGVNLIVDKRDESATLPQIGARWAGTGIGGGFVNVVPELWASYTFANDIDTDSTVQLAAGTSIIDVRGVDTSGYGTVGLGIFGNIGANGQLGVTGSMDFGSEMQSSSVSAVLRFLIP
jgi:hypothetical protein